MENKIKLAILGNGRLANIVVDAYNDGLLKDYEIVAICGRTKEKTDKLADKAGCKSCCTTDEMLKYNPEFVAEAASVQAIRDNAVPIIKSGAQLVILSIGALADNELYMQIKNAASQHNTRVHLVSGAIGGYDLMRTITLMGNGDPEAKMIIRKSPNLFQGSSLYDKRMESENLVAFEGSATEAIQLLPTQVNVAVATALATVGSDNLKVVIKSDMNMSDEQFNIYIEEDRAKAHIKIDSEPHTSSGWSVVAKLQNLASPIMF